MSMDRDKSGAEDPLNRELIDHYRQASAELDERPAASARASILAAAARNVDAKPVDAAAHRRTRPRWPLAAAATVMLSTLAVLLAIRTNEEMPQFGAPTEAARSGADTPPPVTAPRTADTPAAVTAPRAADTPAAGTAPRATDTPAPETARRAADSVEPSAQRAPPPPKVVAPPRERESMEQQVTEQRQAQTRSGRLMAPAKTESDSVAQAARESNRSVGRGARQFARHHVGEGPAKCACCSFTSAAGARADGSLETACGARRSRLRCANNPEGSGGCWCSARCCSTRCTAAIGRSGRGAQASRGVGRSVARTNHQIAA